MNHDLMKSQSKKLGGSQVGSFNSRENLDKPIRKRTNMGIFFIFFLRYFF